jgi:hypothetical protein
MDGVAKDASPFLLGLLFSSSTAQSEAEAKFRRQQMHRDTAVAFLGAVGATGF